MGIRTFFGTLGAWAPRVETVLDREAVGPGETLGATVTLLGGGAEVRVEALALELVTRIEALEEGGAELSWRRPETVSSFSVPAFTLPSGQSSVHTVDCALPWEMPLTHAGGRRLRGTRAALRTTLKIDTAIDRGDFDEIAVHALPAQDAVLEALTSLGFRIEGADVRRGHLRGDTSLAYWQRIELVFPASYNRRHSDRLDLAFATRPGSLDLLVGTFGPYPFAHADLTVESARAWLTSHLDAHWRR